MYGTINTRTDLEVNGVSGCQARLGLGDRVCDVGIEDIEVGDPILHNDSKLGNRRSHNLRSFTLLKNGLVIPR